MKEIKTTHAFVLGSLLVAIAVAGLLFISVMVPGLILADLEQRGRVSHIDYGTGPSIAEAKVDSWAQAVEKVKEDRGEPTGKQARVDIPRQLRHYSDTRRFLAVQYAEWREHQFETPKDFVDLATMIRSGEMVPLQSVNENYILLGVGGNADLERFSRYENGRRIPLYSEAELEQEYARMSESRTKAETDITGPKQEISSPNKRDRARAQARTDEWEKAFKATGGKENLLERYYGDAERRRQLFEAYESLESVAKSFPDRTYDLEDERSRRDMKVRMLSSLRPEALKVMEEVALAYRQKFDRPLPITSLVRPDEYQHALSKVNPNATRMETPPHSTGLAFDIYYKFMTAEEQSFVMAHLARLKDEGRIEVLRENRDHYHAFAFVDGAIPDEALIGGSLNKTRAVKDGKETQSTE